MKPSAATSQASQPKHPEKHDKHKEHKHKHHHHKSDRDGGSSSTPKPAAKPAALTEDTRRCGFCYQGTQPGLEAWQSLVSGGRTVNVHLNCALFSPLVREDAAGKLLNVASELKRGAKLASDVDLLSCVYGLTLRCIVRPADVRILQTARSYDRLCARRV